MEEIPQTIWRSTQSDTYTYEQFLEDGENLKLLYIDRGVQPRIVAEKYFRGHYGSLGAHFLLHFWSIRSFLDRQAPFLDSQLEVETGDDRHITFPIDLVKAVWVAYRSLPPDVHIPDGVFLGVSAKILSRFRSDTKNEFE